jgi:spore coat protein CotF
MFMAMEFLFLLAPGTNTPKRRAFGMEAMIKPLISRHVLIVSTLVASKRHVASLENTTMITRRIHSEAL